MLENREHRWTEQGTDQPHGAAAGYYSTICGNGEWRTCVLPVGHEGEHDRQFLAGWTIPDAPAQPRDAVRDYLASDEAREELAAALDKLQAEDSAWLWHPLDEMAWSILAAWQRIRQERT